jgi:hypothetical protein
MRESAYEKESMNTQHLILPKFIIVALILLVSGAASQVMAQAYKAVILEGIRSFSVPNGQVMEIDSTIGVTTASPVRSTSTSFGTQSTTTYGIKTPSWRLTFSGKSFSSDESSSFSSENVSSSTTSRQALPRKIVGPATLRITPEKNAPFILNYRLVANK